jgi:enoyl-CoA hydratase
MTSNSAISSITTERRGPVFLIGLNRVSKRNAFDPPMFHDLARAYGSYEADPDLWCAVVFAHGPHFTGGIDLAQFAPLFARRTRSRRKPVRSIRSACAAIYRSLW